MDLKQYFKKIRDTEGEIEEQYPLIVSLDTPDGGKAGAIVEVSRLQAAKAIAENRAILATDDQRTAHYAREASRKKSAEKAELARRLQIAIISDPELRSEATKKEEEPKGSR
jgi:hypothetical protein